MRARGIKPAFFKNEELADLPHQARLLYIGLWCLADRDGRLEDRPKRIKAELFPYEKADIDGMLTLLADRGFIRRYGPVDKPCIDIPTFLQHQYPHKNEKSLQLPAYGDISESSGTKTEPLRLTDDCCNLTPDCGLRTVERGPDHELLDELLDTAASVRGKKAAWRPDTSDRQTFAALGEQFPPEQIRRELLNFKAYAAQREYRDFGRAFASWMSRVTPLPMVAPKPSARSERIARAVQSLQAGMTEGEVKAFVLDETELREAMSGIGREMP